MALVLRGGLLFQFSFKSLLAIGNVGAVAGGIDERVAVAGFEARVFLRESEIGSVRAQEDIAGQALEHLELMAVVVGDARIGRIAHQFVAGIDIRTANDDNVERAPTLFLIKSPGGGSLGMAGGPMRGQHRASERDLVAVVQDAIDVRGGKPKSLVGRVVEVGPSAGLNHGDIAIHHFVAGVGFTQNLGAARAMVVVPMTDEKDLDVGEMEAERLHAFFDQGGRRLEIAVEEDVALRRHKEVSREVAGAHVIKISRDAKGGERRCPVRGDDGACLPGEQHGHEEDREDGEFSEYQWDSGDLVPGIRISRARSR